MFWISLVFLHQGNSFTTPEKGGGGRSGYFLFFSARGGERGVRGDREGGVVFLMQIPGGGGLRKGAGCEGAGEGVLQLRNGTVGIAIQMEIRSLMPNQEPLV